MKQLNVRVPDEIHEAVDAHVEARHDPALPPSRQYTKGDAVEAALRSFLGLAAETPTDAPESRLAAAERRIQRLETAVGLDALNAQRTPLHAVDDEPPAA